MRVLVGDVGATHCRLALVDEERETRREEIYSSRDHDGLGAVVERFVGAASDGSFAAACFGVAGPVRNGRSELTNLPWRVDASKLECDLGRPVAVINDLEAVAWSLDRLGPEDEAVIHAGTGSAEAEGHRAVIAPGTGLGEAGLFWDGRRHRPFATEGGHADFAPGDALEWQLRSELVSRHGRVSWERVVSGPGLVEIHRFLCSHREGPTGCPVESMARDDEAAGPAITRGALERSCSICIESLDRFCRLLGAEAGNLALKLFATGGVWIAGGIAPSIVEVLRDGPFREAFLAKGRMRKLLETIPVRVILDDKAGLVGATRVASRLAAGGRDD